MLLVSLISLIVVMMGIMIIFLWVDKEGIINGLRTKMLKGYSEMFIINKDNTIEVKTIRTSGKANQKNTFKVGSYEYKIDPKRMFYHNRNPAWIYKDGDVEPIDPANIQQLEGLDGELIAGLVEKARLTAQAPIGKVDTKEQLMFVLAMVSAGASVTAVLFLVKIMGIA